MQKSSLTPHGLQNKAHLCMAFAAPLGTSIHVILPMQETLETQLGSLGWEDPLEEGTAIHSSILAWRIPGTEEPGGLQSIGSQRVRHD